MSKLALYSYGSKSLVWLLFLAVVGCGGTRNLPEGAPEVVSLKQLQTQQAQALPSFTKLRLSGKGTFTNQGKSQNFKFDVRLLKDSLVWVSLKDPLLGIGLAKGLLSPQNVSYYNSLERNFFEGPPAKLEQEFSFSFNFEWLTALLSAELVTPQEEWQINYVPGYYQLQDFDASGKTPPNPLREVFTEVLLNPKTFTPHQQTLREPVNGRILKVIYGLYEATENSFPQRITIAYSQNSTTTLTLEISSVERDGSFGFPFKIPKSYAPLK